MVCLAIRLLFEKVNNMTYTPQTTILFPHEFVAFQPINNQIRYLYSGWPTVELMKAKTAAISCRCLALGWLIAALLLLLGYRYGSPQPVDGGGGDAPRVARPFSDRIDAFYVALPHLVA